MRQDEPHRTVLILLNTREESRRVIGKALSTALDRHKIPAELLELSPATISRASRSTTSWLITDYLLGEYTTGIDILHSRARRTPWPRTIFFTDEESVTPMHNAFRMGATDYVLFSEPTAIQRLISIIRSYEQQRNLIYPQLLSPTDWITKSTSMRACIAAAEKHAHSSRRCCVIVGAPGSGRRSLARYIYHLRYQGNEHPIELYNHEAPPTRATAPHIISIAPHLIPHIPPEHHDICYITEHPANSNHTSIALPPLTQRQEDIPLLLATTSITGQNRRRLLSAAEFIGWRCSAGQLLQIATYMHTKAQPMSVEQVAAHLELPCT